MKGIRKCKDPLRLGHRVESRQASDQFERIDAPNRRARGSPGSLYDPKKSSKARRTFIGLSGISRSGGFR